MVAVRLPANASPIDKAIACRALKKGWANSPGVLLTDDVGTGKTLQMLALVATLIQLFDYQESTGKTAPRQEWPAALRFSKCRSSGPVDMGSGMPHQGQGPQTEQKYKQLFLLKTSANENSWSLKAKGAIKPSSDNWGVYRSRSRTSRDRELLEGHRWIGNPGFSPGLDPVADQSLIQRQGITRSRELELGSAVLRTEQVMVAVLTGEAITASDLVIPLLESDFYRDHPCTPSLVDKALEIIDLFAKHPRSSTSTFAWARKAIQKRTVFPEEGKRTHNSLTPNSL
ncbi:hypothetical protein B0H14DRAFT_2629940 [Mycena olivaceomarginata]|nr:hypothetical protein B0H14DRAFT_2629940 [Mycena olivaceomarginata]